MLWFDQLQSLARSELCRFAPAGVAKVRALWRRLLRISGTFQLEPVRAVYRAGTASPAGPDDYTGLQICRMVAQRGGAAGTENSAGRAGVCLLHHHTRSAVHDG